MTTFSKNLGGMAPFALPLATTMPGAQFEQDCAKF